MINRSYPPSNLITGLDSRVIWLGDLNYRVSMSFDQAKGLIVDGDWDALLQKDQAI